MLSLICLGLFAFQGSVSIQPPARPRAARVRPSLPTLEGASGAASVGLFDLCNGAFVPERLGDELANWSDLTPVAIDFSGRHEATSGLAASPRLREDVGTGARIELPGGGGTLLQLRGVRQGVLRYAILHVDGDGRPRIVLHAGATAAGASPFLPKIGIDPSGQGALIATRLEVGGDLFEADFASLALERRTFALPPLDFGVDGVWLGSDWGFGIASSGPYRFQRAPLAQAETVPTQGAAPSLWRGDAAVNTTCGGAVAVAGAAPDQWLPYVFGPTGPAIAASTTPASLSGPGYAPEFSYGPFLALCDDGVTAAWRVELGVAPTEFRDLYLGRASDAPVTAVVSGDLQIVDTVNEVARVLPSPIGGILFAVGEDNDPTEGGLEGAEFLRASLDANGVVDLENVTLTSGDTTLPLFDQDIPTWTPTTLVLVAPNVALVHDDNEKALIALDLEQATRVQVMSLVREVFWVEAAGTEGAPGAWIAAVERDNDQRTRQIIGASSAQAAAVVLDAGTSNTEYRTPAAWRGSGHAVAYVRRDLNLEFLDVAQPSSLTRTRWSTAPSAFTPPLVFTGPHSAAFTRGAGVAGGQQRIWNFNGPLADVVLDAPVRPAILLR